MSLAFNSGGLITRGMGEDHRLITRGMGASFDFGGLPSPRAKEVNGVIGLLIPISKENSDEVSIFTPLELIRNSQLWISMDIKKNVLSSVEMVAGINSNQFMEILDEI